MERHSDRAQEGEQKPGTLPGFFCFYLSENLQGPGPWVERHSDRAQEGEQKPGTLPGFFCFYLSENLQGPGPLGGTPLHQLL